LLFLFFHKRLCGPLANSRFHRPTPQQRPDSRLEAAYHRADKAIENSSISWPQPDPSAYQSAENTAAPKRNPTPPRLIGPSLLREKSRDSDLLKSPVALNLDIAPNKIVGLIFSNNGRRRI
jgi:hypothetical protein